MKQSTFSAVMANSIKNLLQGYTKGIRFVAVLTVLLTMGIGQAWAEGTETFETLTNASDYKSRTWTGVNGQTWSATLARTDQKISGNRGLTFSNANSSKTITMKLTEAQRAAGIGTFTFKYKHPYSDSGKTNTFSISVNGSNYSSESLSYTSSTTTKTITINAVPNSTSITITITGTARLCVDDFSWTSYASNKTVYLKPTSAWDNSSAKFAVYYFNNSTNGWSSLMTKVDNKCNNDVYKAEIPSSYTNLIFVRLNNTATAGDWNKKWDQTADLTLSGTNNMYTISAHGSNGGKASGSWSAYKEEVQVTYNFQKTGISNITECVVKGQTTANKSYNLLGWKLEGWYKEAACTNQWNFSTTVTSEMTLYAKWSEPATTTVYLNANSNGVNWTQDNADIWVHAFMSSTGEYKDIQLTPVNTCDVNWLKAEGIPYGVDKLIFLRVADGAGVVWSGSNLWNQAAEIGYSGSTSYYQMDSWSAVKTATAYQPSTYTISYNGGGGTGSMASTTVECDGSITLPANSFTRTGYTFDGWATSANGNKVYNDEATISNINSNITLYARWKANIYTITSNLTNCSSSPAIPASYTYTGSAANLTYTITPESGYRLPDAITVSGSTYTWDNATGKLTLTGIIKSDVAITVTAIQFVDILWYVNGKPWNDKGGSSSIEKNETYQDLTLPTDPEGSELEACYDNKVFVGWSTHDLGYAETTEPVDLFTSDNVPDTEITENTTFYAVFATETPGTAGDPEWVETDIAKITDSDVVVITMTTSGGTTYAMSNDKGTSSAPAATTVTVSNGALSTEPADALKWNISNNNGTLTIYPNGTTETWLYCTSTNNGVRVGTNEDKTFSIDASSGYLMHIGTSRYVGVYTTNPDWRCYTNTTGNTANQTLKFYKETSTASPASYSGYVSKCNCVTGIALSMTGGQHKNLDVGETNQLVVTYTPADATCDNAIDSWTSSNDNILSVSNTGLVTAQMAGTATITAKTAGGVTATYTITVNNPACEAWFIHYWNASTSGDECFYKVKPDDPNDHEWRTGNFSLPSFSNDDMFNVNNAQAAGGDSQKTDQIFRTGIGFADIQRGGQNCGTNIYPGQDAYGQLSIYDDSNSPNRYIAFYPAQYMVTFGKEGSSWEEMPLNNTKGYEYESEPFMVPNGYKTDDTYKYWVGITDKDGNIKYVGYEFDDVEYKKSSVDAMNTVNGLSTSDMAGKWGVWHIWSNSCANNWYAEFIHYYRVDFDLNGGEGDIAPRYGKATTPYVTFSTTDITAPTRDGYTFLGWKDKNNKIYAPTGATVTINNDFTLTALWKENYASDNCRWEEVTIDDIEYGDEVVVTMGTNTTVYALHNTEIITNSPKAKDFSVIGNYLEDFDYSNYSWYIIKTNDGYQLQSCADNSKYLYGVQSYITISNTPTTFYIFKNTENGNECFSYIANSVVYYLGHGTEDSETAWKKLTSTNHLATNTLKFYKKICVDASNLWCTITFDAGSGSCNTKSLTGTMNEGITLPTATPSNACATDGWIFAGWWTEAVAETTTSPGELLTAGSKYKPDEEGKILYAVYSKEETNEGGGATSTEATLSFASTAQRTSFSSTQQVWEQNGITLTNTKGTNDNDAPVADYANPARFYASSSIIISAPGNITKIVFDCNSDSYATAMKNSIGDGASVSDDKVTLELDGKSNTYTISSILAQVRIDALTVTYHAESGPTTTTTYNSNPTCDICENILTINKGAETNGTFILSQIGEIETCDGDVEVVVTPTPTEHYSVSEVTATTPTTGGKPTITNNGDGTWTVTYAQNSQGESTINVTFVEDAKATITLSELGVTTTDNTTYYVGEQYILPTTSSQSCDGKELVGWSTVEVEETDTKPTENYYELGAEVTLEATQTFYAVFATEGEGGGGEYTLVQSADDFTDGVYVIAALDNSTYYFIDGQYTGDGIGVESTGLPVSKMSNNSFTELPSSAVEIEIEDDEDPDGENHYYFISYYDETISNWKFLDDNGTNKTLKWVEWFDGLTVYTYHPVFDPKTYLLSGSGAAISQNGSTKASFIRNYANGSTYNNLYFFKKSGSTNTYTAYTTSCVPTYTITYDFAGGTGSHCSNTSVPQGDSYTICDEAPTKEGHTFLGWSVGTDTYAAGEIITPTGNVILTAQWQINTYTVIWSNNGATKEESYEHGQTLNVPAPEDIPSCDGVKEFVGWTEDNTFTYHATTPPSDIFTEKTATVTADATYYAVFATPPGTGGGGGGSETTTTLDFTAQGYANETDISNLTVDGVTATFDKGSNSNAPKYYTNGTAIRAYGGNTITLSANQITAATFTFGGSDGSNDITADCGSWDSPTWTGDATDEVVFTIGGTSGHRKIQSIAVTYTSGGGSGSYSDYTTICQQIESIEVQNPQTEFYLTDNFTIGEGKVIATLSGGGTADVTALATFSGYDMEKVGTYTVTVTYMGATATYNINVKPLDNAWVLTWNVSGKTNTGLGPRTVNKGSAIGTLPVPEVPAACEGKTFMGWTESNTVPSDGIGIVYITPETVPTDNTTYYAVFATVNNFCTQKPIEAIVSGSKVVVVAVASLTADGGSGKAISSRATDDTHNLQGDSVAIYDETINTPHSTCIWTITKKDGKYVLTQDGKYLNGVLDGPYSNLKYLNTEDSWTLTPAKSGMTMTYNMESTNASGEYIEWYRGKFAIHHEVNDNGDFDMQFYVTLGDGADITDYTTGCEEYTITYYGFRGGYSTSSSSDGIIVLPVNSLHTVPDCGDVVKDHTDLGREFLNLWMTQPHGGQTFKPGDTFILTQDTTLYAQWKLNTTTDVTLPTGVEDLAGTDVYVYGGNTLTMVPDIVTINSLTLKGGLQPDGSYQMPNVWIPDGATLVRNTNKIYLDLAINAKNWYPFAVPFATKNDQYLDYLDPVLRGASTYGKHFAIKTYDGARRAEVGEDKANNWKQLLRHTGGTTSYLEPGVGYIISAMTKSDKDTATIRIPMTVPNTWFENGEQTVVGSTSRNTIAVIAHTGTAATEHRRHAGWNFIASPYLSEFAGNKVDNDGTYINGWINIANQYNYEDTEIPYVTIPVYNFAYYEQKKVSEATLSPEWSFFVQIAVDGTIDFVEEGRQTAPAGIAARTQEERSVKMDIDINLTDGRNTDQMGIIVCEKYSDAYEIGRDLEKMFGSAYNLVVYSLMSDNTPLAYQAVPLLNETHAIPIGYRAPEQGEYTFSLKQNTSSIDLLYEQYEQLVLVDYEKGALTNLLNSDYTFSSERTQSNSRFALYAVPRQDSSTELPNISDAEDAIRKIFYNGHLFIIRNGNVYNGNGQIVK